ncbi:MAG: alpha/beta family hydrolase [Candidatus Sericytochromatia bacterium]
MWKAIVSSFLLAQAGQAASWQKLKTPRGSEVEIQVQLPAGVTSPPLLILAPGQSCNARRPFFEAMAQAALAQQVGLVRLEWSYCVAGGGKGNPSPDLAAELEDLRTVLGYARKLPGIDVKRILIGGKSLGSLVAWKLLQEDAAIPAAALLTPVCSYDRDDKEQVLPEPKNLIPENYPGLAAESRPLLFVLGNQDSLCHPPLLYAGLAQTRGKASVVVVGGGHGLNLVTADKKDDPAGTERNLKSAALALFNWVRLVADHSP